MKFSEMGLSPTTLAALEAKGFETPSPIQAQCIPLLLSGTKDIIGQAQTGTGKTAAFAIPVIEKIDPTADHVQAVVIAPTRELAIQVAREIDSLSGAKRLKVVQVYGGASMRGQLKNLRNGAHIVVGTPGRMIDMINRGKLKLGKIDFCILDEADEMLNMGFLDEIESILEACNPQRQMLCFSATMPAAIKRVAEKYMGEYNLIKVEAKQLTTRNVKQQYISLRQSEKFQALTRIIDAEEELYGIIFCKTKRGCDELVHGLQNHGYKADAMHGDMNQKQRELALAKFRKKQSILMIATDVAARGIDVDDLTHVVNYDIPQDSETYTHRIGRTGRAGKDGIALTFVTKKDQRKIKGYERAIKTTIQQIQLPTIESVIEAKKTRIMDKISKKAQNVDTKKYEKIITKLTQDLDPTQLIAGLIDIAYGKKLDSSTYKKIQAVSGRGDRGDRGERGGRFERGGSKDSTRLFVARGRDDGLKGPRDLVFWLQDQTGVKQSLMDDVGLRDICSFVSVPNKEAKKILEHFKSLPGKPLVTVSTHSHDQERKQGSGRKKFGKGSRKARDGDRKHHGHKHKKHDKKHKHSKKKD